MSIRGRQLLLLLGIMLLATAAACFPSHPQSTFDPAGPIAEGQAGLFRTMFVVMAIVFVVVEGVLVYAIFRFRRKSADEMPEQSHGNTRLEIAWTIAPVLLLLIVMVPSVQLIFENADTPGDAYEVAVIGHQWWWEFEYTDCGDVDCAGLNTANELHIPQGQPVNFTLVSDDVIHSFWVPKIGGKRDVLPVPNNADGDLDLEHQRANQLWLQGDKIGEFFGQCAELCGISHANMRFRVMVDSPSDFSQWVNDQKATASLPDTGNAAYTPLTTLCIACHTIKGTILAGTAGPDLTHYGSRTTLGSSMADNNAENLKEWLRDPEGFKPGNKMALLIKENTLNTEQIDALTEYLLSLN